MATDSKSTLTAGYGSVVPVIDYAELRQSMSHRPSLLQRFLIQYFHWSAHSVKPTHPSSVKVQAN